ncbi:MAG: helicase [Spiribacter salinus]|uniref:Helicase n=1 Tax=Spiribacter salinus TaxID=1335746 RepID=A0A540VFC6_9GAMM|nr:MAG: helicase [Spiribacter salinus]
MEDYGSFLQQKVTTDPPTGLVELPDLPECLFDFQGDIVRWSLRRGRAAIFAGTGLGKSLMELSWAAAVHEATGKDVLILAPLAVAAQMIREADKFGIQANQCATQSEVVPGITVTNYQKLDHFDPDHFVGVVLDESSILKALDGKTKMRLIETFKETPFLLAATATPAPNDFMELGNHAEFLGVMKHTEMLSTFFVHDGGETQKWRLKGHAEEDFWRWMGSWSIMLRDPSDLGYDATRFDLPPLEQHQHTVETENAAPEGMLFAMEAQTLQERLSARRASVTERVEKAAEITPADRPFVWWCHLNSESEALAKAIPGAVEVRGSDKEDEKERKLAAFADGDIRVLISKPSITGFGLNWQHCADTGFVGLNDSFEQVYQAIRRFWRFGQTRPVHVHFVASDMEGAVVDNLKRKEAQAERMAAQMVEHMADITAETLRGTARRVDEYDPQITMRVPSWIKQREAA